jgi:ribose-phosphate pyrophosphokinase
MDKGAAEVYAFLSHAIVNKEAVARIEDSPIKMLVTTDTVDNSEVLKDSTKIKVVSVAPLFAAAVRTIHEKEAMAEMFANLPEKLLNMSFEDTK